MPHTSELPRVSIIPGQQIVNGEPCDTRVDVVDREAIISDTPDRHELAIRAFECGLVYGRTEADARMPQAVPIIPLAPVQGIASARPPKS